MEQIVKERQSDAGGKAAGAKPDAAACQASGLTGGAGMSDWRPNTGHVLCCARARYRRAYLYWRPFAGIYCENCYAFILTCHPILSWIWRNILHPIVGRHAYRIHPCDPVHVKVVNAEGRDQVGDKEADSMSGLTQKRDILRAKLDDLLAQRMDEADAKLATRLVEQLVEELQAENRRLRFVAERVVRANKDVERHGYASLRRMVYALENVLWEVQGCD